VRLSKKSSNRLLKIICCFILLILICPLKQIAIAQALSQPPSKKSIEDLDKDGKAFSLTVEGQQYNRSGEFQKALDCYNQALQLFKEMANQSGEANVLNSLASIYRFLGEKEQALNNYNQALKIFQKIKDLSGEMMTLGYIGELYYALPDKPSAAKYFEDKLKIMKTIENQRIEASLSTYLRSPYEVSGNLNTPFFNEQAFTQSLLRGNWSSKGEGRYYGGFGDRFLGLDRYNPVSGNFGIINVFSGDLMNMATGKNGAGSYSFTSTGTLLYQEYGHLNPVVAALQFQRAANWSSSGANVINNLMVSPTFLSEKERASNEHNLISDISYGINHLPDKMTTIPSLSESTGISGLRVPGNPLFPSKPRIAAGEMGIGEVRSKHFEAYPFTFTWWNPYQSFCNLNTSFSNEQAPAPFEIGSDWLRVKFLYHGGFDFRLPGQKERVLNRYGLTSGAFHHINDFPDKMMTGEVEVKNNQLEAGRVTFKRSFQLSNDVMQLYNDLDLPFFPHSQYRIDEMIQTLLASNDFFVLPPIFGSSDKMIAGRIANRNAEADTFTSTGGLVYQRSGNQNTSSFNKPLSPQIETKADGFGKVVVVNNIDFSYGSPDEKELPLYRNNQIAKDFHRINDFSVGRMTREISFKRVEADTLKANGVLSELSGKQQEALNYYKKALALIQETSDRQEEAKIQNSLGGIYDQMGETKRALESYEKALKIIEPMKDCKEEIETRYNIARANRDLGKWSEAGSELKKLFQINETVRIRLTSHTLRTSYIASTRHFDELYIDVQTQRDKQDPSKGYASTAFEISERMRARPLLESLVESRINIGKEIDPNLRKLRGSLQQLSGHLVTLLSNGSAPKQISEVQDQIAELTTKYEEVLQRRRSSNSCDAENVQSISGPAAQQLLDADTMLLAYFLGKEKSFLFVVTQSSIGSFELSSPGGKIKRQVDKVYGLLKTSKSLNKGSHRDGSNDVPPAKGNDVPSVKVEANKYSNEPVEPANFNFQSGKGEDEYVREAEQLSRMLLGPIAKRLTAKRLVIVADDDLLHVAFSALPKPDFTQSDNRKWQPLIVDHEIVIIPSATILDILRKRSEDRQPASRTLAVFADPVFDKDDERVGSDGNKSDANQPPEPSIDDLPEHSQPRSGGIGPLVLDRLPYSRWEAEEILKLVHDTEKKFSAFDFAANRATAIDPELGKYQILHFATHGIFYNAHPVSCGIMLSQVDKYGVFQDGFLGVYDIDNLKLPVELVVLSACDSGLGKEVKGAGLRGITQAFMCAGASRVVVSSWAVDDRATAEFMKYFYEEMLGPNQQRPAAAALRAAQIKMWQKGSAPYYWAAFVLQGEWKGEWK
jgi:CHAT domain-containing protein/Flp pilus assembly protein TadD